MFKEIAIIFLCLATLILASPIPSDSDYYSSNYETYSDSSDDLDESASSWHGGSLGFGITKRIGITIPKPSIRFAPSFNYVPRWGGWGGLAKGLTKGIGISFG